MKIIIINSKSAFSCLVFFVDELANLCKGQFPTQMHRKVDGALITSRNDKNLDCTVTFSTEYVSQRFLIRFEEFSMACGDRLYIYDSANAIGNPRVRTTFFRLPPLKIHMYVSILMCELCHVCRRPFFVAILFPEVKNYEWKAKFPVRILWIKIHEKISPYHWNHVLIHATIYLMISMQGVKNIYKIVSARP